MDLQCRSLERTSNCGEVKCLNMERFPHSNRFVKSRGCVEIITLYGLNTCDKETSTCLRNKHGKPEEEFSVNLGESRSFGNRIYENMLLTNQSNSKFDRQRRKLYLVDKSNLTASIVHWL